jgi:micrococcal nuclease
MVSYSKRSEIMRKRLSIVVSVFLLLAVAVSVFAQNPTVYITKTGAKYHTGTCRYLSKSKIPISLSDAAARGYTPCSVCRPPVPSSQSAAPPTTPNPEPSPAPAAASAAQLYRVNAVGLSSYRYADLGRLLPAKVAEHVDGDTVKVAIQNPPEGLKGFETIRLLGVDTPETVHPQKPVERFGKEASEFTRNRLLGKQVLLAFDWDLWDKYNRLLAYIYLPDGSCHNADIVREGYGHAYTEFPFQFLEEFRLIEQYARENKKGLWQ